MQRQQEVLCHLEARRILGPKLPNTIQEEQEDWRLQGGKRRGSERHGIRRNKEIARERQRKTEMTTKREEWKDEDKVNRF